MLEEPNEICTTHEGDGVARLWLAEVPGPVRTRHVRARAVRVDAEIRRV